jgi:RNA polymerase sigma factor (sigma-70 family)
VPTITGEVKKHFRDRAWTVRPPRRIQDLQSRISATLPELQQQLHRSPTPAQVAEALDEPIEDVIEALAADGCFLPSSLDRPVVNEQGAAALGDLLGAPDPDLDRTEAHLTLIPAVQSLTEEDRKIIELRFFHDLSQIQIAEQLGTNQMRVSRALTRILSTCATRSPHDQPGPGDGAELAANGSQAGCGVRGTRRAPADPRLHQGPGLLRDRGHRHVGPRPAGRRPPPRTGAGRGHGPAGGHDVFAPVDC